MARPSKPKPATEIILSELQAKWFETKDEQYLKKIFENLVPYAKSLCLKMTTGKAFLEPAKVWGIAVDASAKFMEYYNKEGFTCEHSFAGLLKWKVIEKLYGDRPKNKNLDQDRFISLNDMIGDGGVEFGDLVVKFNIEGLWTPIIHEIAINEITFKQDFFRIMNEFDQVAKNLRLSFLARLFVLSILRTKKNSDQKDLFSQRLKLSFQEVQALDLLLLEIRNRLIETLSLDQMIS